MKIAYFADCFPVTSETFVINEIDEVATQGDSIVVVSINTPSSRPAHELGTFWMERTTYLEGQSNNAFSLALNWFALMIDRPGRVISALVWTKRKDSLLRWRFRRCLQLALRLKQEKIAHMHVHFASEAAEFCWIVNKLTGISFSVSTHGYDIYDRPYRYYQMLAGDSSFIRSVCEYNTKELIRLGVPANKVKLVHCGIRLNQFQISDAESSKPIDVICVARLHPVKGIQYLIEAVSAIVEKFSDLNVVIVGDGEERASLEKLGAEYGVLGNIQFLGSCSQDKVRDLLSRSKIFCLPSLGDSAAVAIMEAMAMELPVVSTTVKGVPELISDGVNGCLVPPGDSASLSKKIQMLLADSVLRATLGREARKCITVNFNQQIEVAKLRELFKTSSASNQ